MTKSSRSYLPAAGHDWSLPLYDPLVKLLGGDAVRNVLLEQADIRPGQRVLDLGCGTGTLPILIKRIHPDVEVVGIDPDPKALARARQKAKRAGVSIQFDQGFGDTLPYAEASFDRVVSSLMFHHVPAEEKENMLLAVRRVLNPGGEFHMVDFEGHAHGAHSLLARLFHFRDRMKDNAEERVLQLMRQAGFVEVQKTGSRAMLFGRVAYYRASL